MTDWNLLCILTTFVAGALLSTQTFAQIPQVIDQATRSWGAALACQNPSFDFNQAEMEKCAKIVHLCQRPEMRPSEFKPCVVNAVRNGRLPPAAPVAATQPDSVQRTPVRPSANMQFSFTAAETRDLVALCDQPSNQATALCVTILRDKRRILQALR